MEDKFDIGHRAGIKHQAADALSRPNTERVDDFDIDDDILIMKVNTHAWSQQNNHNHTTPDKSVTETTEPDIATVNEFFRTQSTYTYCDKIQPTMRIPMLSFKFEKNRLSVILSDIVGDVRIIVAQSVRSTILQIAHLSTVTGHSGESRVYDTLQREYFNPNMSTNLLTTKGDC